MGEKGLNKRVVLDLVSSEDEGYESGVETKKPKLHIKDVLNRSFWVDGSCDIVVGVDPGPRNFSICKYSVSKECVVDWDWVDFQGVNKSKRSARQIVEQLELYIQDHPEFFDQADLIAVETQIVKGAKNIQIQRYLMRQFPGKCIEACPKRVKKAMEQWISMPTAQYALKKKTTVEFGWEILTKHEKELVETMRRGRKILQDKITVHDTKMIQQGRIKIKKPRRIKSQPADAFDAMMIAMCVTCELLDQDVVAPRLVQLAQRKKRASITRWTN